MPDLSSRFLLEKSLWNRWGQMAKNHQGRVTGESLAKLPLPIVIVCPGQLLLRQVCDSEIRQLYRRAWCRLNHDVRRFEIAVYNAATMNGGQGLTQGNANFTQPFTRNRRARLQQTGKGLTNDEFHCDVRVLRFSDTP